ncbi:MAG: hypothetical protein WCD63_02340, partial [Terrimicrobiaceae bacterium]
PCSARSPEAGWAAMSLSLALGGGHSGFSDEGFWLLPTVQSKKIDNGFVNKNKALLQLNPTLLTFTP